VGRNGQGKSTLLKVIAGVLLPDRGSVAVREGVAPLIEITGGFVGDLTVRENINLTAGLHGMSRAAIAERFDEIADFAEIHDFLDTPYKHLSSGMKVRVAFAVISRLEEPIILVDEVLAVGDRVFKEKCYRRIEELLAAGRTLFLVSHSEGDLKRFCTRGIYLERGVIRADGTLDEALECYTRDTAA
jgi:ABC-2 type transport system ATP-binding protein